MSKIYYTIPELRRSKIDKKYDSLQDAENECKKYTIDTDIKSWKIIKHIEEEIPITINKPIEFINSPDDIKNVFIEIKKAILEKGKNWANRNSIFGYGNFTLSDDIINEILKILKYKLVDIYPNNDDRYQIYNQEVEYYLSTILENYPTEKIQISKISTGINRQSGIYFKFLTFPTDEIPELKQKGYTKKSFGIIIAGNNKKKPAISFIKEPIYSIKKKVGVDLTKRSTKTYIDRTLKLLQEEINKEK